MKNFWAWAFVSFIVLSGLFHCSTAVENCHVRSSGCHGAEPVDKRSLEGSIAVSQWKFNMLSAYHGPDFFWVFEWGPYDIFIDALTPIGTGPTLEVELRAVDTIRLVFTKQQNGLYATTMTTTVATGVQDAVKLKAQKNILDVLQWADRVEMSADQKKLTFYRGPWHVTFDRYPLAAPVVGQEFPGVPPPEVQQWPRRRELYLVPETYFVDGHFEKLYPIGVTPFELVLHLTPMSENSVIVVLYGVGTHVYQIQYQPTDGWVTQVDLLSTSRFATVPEIAAVDGKVVDIVRRVQQVAFEKDGVVQFITNDGQTRVSFAPSKPVYGNPDSGKVPASVETTVDPPPPPPSVSLFPLITVGASKHFHLKRDLVTSGTSPPIPSVGGARSIPLSMSVRRQTFGFFRFVVKGVDTLPYDVTLDETTGYVNSVGVRPTTALQGKPELSKAQENVKLAFLRLNRLSMDVDTQELTFFDESGRIQMVFAPMETFAPEKVTVGAFDLILESYMTKGQLQSLATVLGPFKGTLDIYEYHPGVADFMLQVLNTRSWQIEFNPTDGWVKSIRTGPTTLTAGPPEVIAAEAQVAAIFSHAQQIAFEKDGMVQVITDDTKTRVAFKQRPLGLEVKALSLLDPMTYMEDGTLVPLYSLTSSPTSMDYPVLIETHRVAPGHLRVVAKLVSVSQFEIFMDETTGIVSKVVSVSQLPQSLTYTAEAARNIEHRVRSVLAECKAVMYLRDGLNFHTTEGGFATQFVTVNTYTLRPETYYRDGAFVPFFTGSPFPVTMELTQDKQRATRAEVQAAGTLVFSLRFDDITGRVLRRGELGLMASALTVDERDAQLKLREILSTVEEVRLETDGSIYFLTNERRTHIAFKGDSFYAWRTATPSGIRSGPDSVNHPKSFGDGPDYYPPMRTLGRDPVIYYQVGQPPRRLSEDSTRDSEHRFEQGRWPLGENPMDAPDSFRPFVEKFDPEHPPKHWKPLDEGIHAGVPEAMNEKGPFPRRWRPGRPRRLQSWEAARRGLLTIEEVFADRIKTVMAKYKAYKQQQVEEAQRTGQPVPQHKSFEALADLAEQVIQHYEASKVGQRDQRGTWFGSHGQPRRLSAFPTNDESSPHSPPKLPFEWHDSNQEESSETDDHADESWSYSAPTERKLTSPDSSASQRQLDDDASKKDRRMYEAPVPSDGESHPANFDAAPRHPFFPPPSDDDVAKEAELLAKIYDSYRRDY